MASLDAKACKEPFVKMNAQTQNGLSVSVNMCMHSMYKKHKLQGTLENGNLIEIRHKM